MRVPIVWLSLPVVATLCGGVLALRFARYRPVLLAAGAGLLLGAAFLDLMPEAITLGAGVGWTIGQVLGLILGFFLLFSLLDTWLADWSERRLGNGTDSRRAVGRLAGCLMIFHSFRDGMAIGAAFAASHPVGYAVATGIAAHDLGDGMNTVLLTTGGARPRAADFAFLALDAAAPFAGGLLAVWWLLSGVSTVVLLALAAGFFLEMATSDFLPQLRQPGQDRRPLMLVVLAGAGAIYCANLLLAR